MRRGFPGLSLMVQETLKRRRAHRGQGRLFRQGTAIVPCDERRSSHRWPRFGEGYRITQRPCC
ncbi:hypothetical protein ACC668_02840 [Rhizobium ruizarguesonis]